MAAFLDSGGALGPFLSQFMPWSLIFVNASIVGATLAHTERSSPLRILSMLAITGIAYVQMSTYVYFQQMWIGMVGATSAVQFWLQALMLFFVKGIRPEELERSFSKAFAVIIAPRAIGTQWQVKGVAPFPASVGPKPRRAPFLARQIAILTWQFFLLDFFLAQGLHQTAEEKARLYPPGSEWTLPWQQGGEQLGARVALSLTTWFIISRVMIDGAARASSIIIVGLGISEPDDFPPFFGSMADAYTLRGFWGSFWHQAVRWPYTEMATLLTRRILRLPKPSLVERYTHVVAVFFQSALMHVFVDYGIGIPLRETGAIPFFTSFAFGIMIEDAAQELYRRATATKKIQVRLWHRAVGFAWVAFWFVLVSPSYSYPQVRLSGGLTVLGFLITKDLDPGMVAATLLTTGLSLLWAVGGVV